MALTEAARLQPASPALQNGKSALSGMRQTIQGYVKRGLRGGLRNLGYEIHRVPPRRRAGSDGKGEAWISGAARVDPIWPLPRRQGGLSDDQIRAEFAKYDLWHYAYAFEGGLSFSARHHDPGLLADAPERPLQRFRHFMPYLIAANGGCLRGKRVLDIACNSGFWSIQCALLGAEVVGFDGRAELVEQANLVKSIVGIDNVQFRVLDFWSMTPQALGGTFDIVLNLGILYHLTDPLKALELTQRMARECILLDTGVAPAREPVVKLRWEEPSDIRAATRAGIVAFPSESGVDLMLRHIGVARWLKIPRHVADMPLDYLDGTRASWIIKVA